MDDADEVRGLSEAAGDCTEKLLRDESIAALPNGALRRLLQELREEDGDRRTTMAKNHTKHTKKYSRW